jgi:hypothetical protein
MRNSPDPAVHQQLERQMIEHVERLLGDERLRVDTTRGRRPVTTLFRAVETGDRAVDLKRVMAEMGRPDRELQSKMPQGAWMEVTLAQKKLFFLREIVGKIQVVCISPTRSLLGGEAPQPLRASEVQKFLTELSMASRGVDIPSTVVMLSTSGFAMDAHELAERRADRTLILAEPNDAGGWRVTGPVETQALVDLFDPEADYQKRQRLRGYIAENEIDLLTSGIPTDKVAAKTQLPLTFVEAELKSYAKEKPGLNAKRIDGRIVLFREGVSGVTPPDPGGGGSDMPFLERVKSLFSKKGNDDKKIAFLSERRAALSQQQDRIYEDLGRLEEREADLRQQFKDSTSALTKRRLTSQLLQYRKDIERRQQMLSVISQQVNVVNTHLHSLELVRQGQSAKLPDSEELTADAVKAEEFLAQLQSENEIAGSVGGMAGTGLSDEEQALFEELEREAAAEKGGDEAATTTQVRLDTVETPEERAEAARSREKAAPESPEPIAERERDEPPPIPTTTTPNRRSEPEPG